MWGFFVWLFTKWPCTFLALLDAIPLLYSLISLQTSWDSSYILAVCVCLHFLQQSFFLALITIMTSQQWDRYHHYSAGNVYTTFCCKQDLLIGFVRGMDVCAQATPLKIGCKITYLLLIYVSFFTLEFLAVYALANFAAKSHRNYIGIYLRITKHHKGFTSLPI